MIYKQNIQNIHCLIMVDHFIDGNGTRILTHTHMFSYPEYKLMLLAGC